MIAVDGLLLRTLKDLKDQLATVKPVQVHRDINKTSIIFTDGSFEPSSWNPAAVGAVLVSPSRVVTKFFGEWVHKQIVDQLLVASNHPIYELEILPVLLAATRWGPYIANSLVVVFLDNEAA
jgi:glyoxylate carboligase